MVSRLLQLQLHLNQHGVSVNMTNKEEPSLIPIRDGGLIAAPPQPAADASSSIRVPQADTTLGADFGGDIGDDDRLFAAKREPIAGFLIYGVAADIVEKWFSINDVETKQPDPKLDRAIQKELRRLKYKQVLRTFIEFKRLYGDTLLVGSFDDAQKLTDLTGELSKSASLKHLTVFPKTQYNVAEKDTDPESFRYGQPTQYQIQNGSQNFRVHYTRVYEHVGDSILDLIWDDLTCGRNIRWGVAQWVYRVGGGFAVIKFPKEYSPGSGQPVIPTTPAKLQEWAAAAAWNDITHRKYICIINEVMDFKFEGAQGAVLNPEPFFDTNTKQIAKATGIPKSILEGAEAGALTGSEKNDQQYYKKISGEQSNLDDVNRWVIDHVLKQDTDRSAQQDTSLLRRMLHKALSSVVKDTEPLDYDIAWTNAFELSKLDEARVELTHAQAKATELDWKTIDEVREDDGLKPLPLGEGAKLKQAANPFTEQPGGEDPQNQEPPIGVGDAVPDLRTLLQPVLKQVMEGKIGHDIAVQQGTALIEFYSGVEHDRALAYNRGKFKQPTLTLSPEQEQDLTDQKTRLLQEFLALLAQAEKLWQSKQPPT